MSDPRLAAHRAVWEEKPVLRAIYGDYYKRLAAACRHGRSLEIGGGTGRVRHYLPAAVLTDIQPAPWLDAVADAQALPFADSSFDNIVMLDVLHHIQSPPTFFTEARRVLRPHGRLIMLEPAMTPLSRIFYVLFHPEPVRMKQDPLAEATPDPARDPYDANQAVPTILFRRARARFERRFPDLAVREVRLLSLFAYPLSGGFRRWSLIPTWAVKPALALEAALLPLLGGFMAFRLFVMLERLPGSDEQ